MQICRSRVNCDVFRVRSKLFKPGSIVILAKGLAFVNIRKLALKQSGGSKDKYASRPDANEIHRGDKNYRSLAL